jgi:centrosomal protein CEP19
MSHIFNNTITPIKVGVKFDPPSLILVYRDKSKLRSRTIPAKGVDILTDIRVYVQQFKKEPKNKVFFDKISNNKLEKILFILQDNMKGYTLDESIERAKKYDHNNHDNEDKNNTSINDTSQNDLFSDSHTFDQKLAQLKNDYEDDYEMDDEEDEEEIKKQIDDLRASSEIVKSINSKREEKEEADDDEDKRKSDVEVEEIEEEINNDFPDTDEEEEKNPQSVSTISDVKAKKDNQLLEKDAGGKPTNIMSKSSALDLLSSHIKSVKSNIYDFEEDDLDEEEVKTENKEEDKIETAHNESNSSDSSF